MIYFKLKQVYKFKQLKNNNNLKSASGARKCIFIRKDAIKGLIKSESKDLLEIIYFN